MGNKSVWQMTVRPEWHVMCSSNQILHLYSLNCLHHTLADSYCLIHPLHMSRWSLSGRVIAEAAVQWSGSCLWCQPGTRKRIKRVIVLSWPSFLFRLPSCQLSYLLPSSSPSILHPFTLTSLSFPSPSSPLASFMPDFLPCVDLTRRVECEILNEYFQTSRFISNPPNVRCA